MVPTLLWKPQRNLAVIFATVSVVIVFLLDFGSEAASARTVGKAGVAALVSAGIGYASGYVLGWVFEGMNSPDVKGTFTERNLESLQSLDRGEGATSTETGKDERAASETEEKENTNKTTTDAPQVGAADGAQREREGTMISNST